MTTKRRKVSKVESFKAIKAKRNNILTQPLRKFNHLNGDSDDERMEKSSYNVAPTRGDNVEIDEDDADAKRIWTNTDTISDSEDDSNALPILLPRTQQWRIKKSLSSKTVNSSKVSLEESNKSLEDEFESSTNTLNPDTEPVRIKLARIALAITEAGLISVCSRSSKDHGEKEEGIHTIFKLCDPRIKIDPETSSLAICTLLALFKDLMPGYRIRPLTAAELAAPVSKDVRSQRSTDESYLNAYRRFISILKAYLLETRGGSRSKLRKVKNRPVLRASILCLCEVLTFASHFNFYEDILRTAVHVISDSFYQNCGLVPRLITAIRRVFDEDKDGQATATALRILSTAAQEREYDVPISWIEALETVRFKDADRLASSKNNYGKQKNSADSGTIDLAVGSVKKVKHLSGKQKKEEKARLIKANTVAQMEAVCTREEISKWCSEGLKHLMRIYFGVVSKTTSVISNDHLALLNDPVAAERLGLVLVGLARHAHRIDVELFCDLLRTLRILMEPLNALPLSSPANSDEKSRKKNADGSKKKSSSSSLSDVAKYTVPVKRPERLPLIAAIHCITAMERIHALNEALAGIDVKFFYNALFRHLGNLAFSLGVSDKKSVDYISDTMWTFIRTPLFSVLASLFHAKRHLPAVRIAAFLQRLFDCISSARESGRIDVASMLLEGPFTALMSQPSLLVGGGMHGFTSLFPKDEDQCEVHDLMGIYCAFPGKYQPNCPDPDLSGPFNRPLSPLLDRLCTEAVSQNQMCLSAAIKKVVNIAKAN